MPVDVTCLALVSSLTVGFRYTCALTAQGGVKCWGQNDAGQVGDSSTSIVNLPVDVVGIGTGATGVSAGFKHTCARMAAGGVKCWGRNVEGALGNNTTQGSLVPVDVIGL